MARRATPLLFASTLAALAAIIAMSCQNSSTSNDGGMSDSGSGADAGDAGSQGGDAGCPARLVKALFLAAHSGAMCVVDPPGSQPGTGFCTQFTVDGGISGRVGAISGYQSAQADSGLGVSSFAALLPWDTIPRPIPSAAPWFIPTSTLTAAQLDSLQQNVGGVDDLQGALEDAAQNVEQDILASTAADRARTAYVVVVLGSGVPFPRCSSNDTLSSYADAGNPSGVWADESPYCNTGPNGACDPTTGRDDAGQLCIPGFLDGGDRNQNVQLFAAVDRLMGFPAQYGVGYVRVHTRLLFDQAALSQCGAVCSNLFGTTLSSSDAHAIGTWTLQQIALRGDGGFVDPGDPQTLTLGDIDFRPLFFVCQ